MVICNREMLHFQVIHSFQSIFQATEDLGGDHTPNLAYWTLLWKYKMIEVFHIISSSDTGPTVRFLVNEACNLPVSLWNCLIISLNTNASLRLHKNATKLVAEGKNKFYPVGIPTNCNLQEGCTPDEWRRQSCGKRKPTQTCEEDTIDECKFVVWDAIKWAKRNVLHRSSFIPSRGQPKMPKRAGKWVLEMTALNNGLAWSWNRLNHTRLQLRLLGTPGNLT